MILISFEHVPLDTPDLEPLRDPYEFDYLESLDFCMHFADAHDRSCVPCYGDGSETIEQCREPGSGCTGSTWHRGGRCLRCTTAWAEYLAELIPEELEVFYSREDQGFIARFKEMPTLSAFGIDPYIALNELRIVAGNA
jgi:hypothetical protein